MKYFIDTEFNAPGAGKPIELISIGIEDEAGGGYYRENRDALALDVSPWIRENVFPHLELSKRRHHSITSISVERIGYEIRSYLADDQRPEFWGYYCAYDYVILSQLMGGMDGWPQGWPYLMYDLRQWLDDRGLSHVSQPDDAPHNALQDARWIAETYQQHASAAEKEATR